jgi:hypothetical protein
VTTTEERLAAWRAEVPPTVRADPQHLQELETVLRSELTGLGSSGLPDDEAWLLAVKRLGDRTAPSPAAASERTEQLWRQLARRDAGAEDGVGDATDRGPARNDASWREALVFAVAAAAVIQVARLTSGLLADGEVWLVRNAALLVLPFLAAYLARDGGRTRRQMLAILGLFVAAALVINLFPFASGGATELLAVTHLPVALWAVVGYAWVGSALGTPVGRLALVRSSGSWFVTFVLFALGGGVLLALTAALLAPIGLLDPEVLLPWVLPSGAAGAVIIAAWLVQSRPQVVGAVAPMLATVFTPLFAVMLVGVTIAYAVTGLGAAFDRELLATFDALLVVVVALVLFRLAAREGAGAAGWQDRTLLVAVAAALVLDLLVLGAMAVRIGDLGLTPNRVAALGLNLVLLGNLAGTAWHGLRFVRGRAGVEPLQRWQTAYLPVFPLWAASVVVVLPPLFSFA